MELKKIEKIKICNILLLVMVLVKLCGKICVMKFFKFRFVVLILILIVVWGMVRFILVLGWNKLVKFIFSKSEINDVLMN